MRSLPRGMAAAIVVVAVLLAAEVARLTVAGTYAETRPALAERLAPRLPDVLAGQAMAEVGQAAAKGETPPPAAIERLRHLARVAPLETEPFLVHGAIAQRSGDFDRAEQLLLEARRRDPRSAAARYLLADSWLRDGRIEEGLGEMAVLSRILPQSSAQLMPALEQYAKSPRAAERLKRILVGNPRLKQPLLNALAADPENLGLILELHAAVPGPDERRAHRWQARLLNGLVRQGDYERAYALWQRLSGFGGSRPLLFNPDFRNISAPPPFNWTFASSGAGFAEPANGSLRVLHYGRTNVTLASQLLLLAPGTYTLSASATGTAVPGALAWVLSCATGSRTLTTVELGSQAPARRAFEVPGSGCTAQVLELKGRAQDMPQQSDIMLGPVIVERAGG